jgi:hypothetical protein
MVSHINVAVDDPVFERAKAIKEENGWSWPEFFERATEQFEEADE